MAIVRKFNKEVLKELRKHFSDKGTIKACAETTGLGRNTIPRALMYGRAEEETINKMLEYYNGTYQEKQLATA